jgi:hypothetical protein
MIYEIVTPYDASYLADCYDSLAGLFHTLSILTKNVRPGDQLEICVLRFKSWEARYKAIFSPDYDSSKYVVLDLDEL